MAVGTIGASGIAERVSRHIVRADLAVCDRAQVRLIGVVALNIKPDLNRVRAVQVGEVISA